LHTLKNAKLEFDYSYPCDETRERTEVRYKREIGAYRRLMSSGACASGVVPKCYGWVKLDGKGRGFPWHDSNPRYGLFLKYIREAVPLNVNSITVDLANQVIVALTKIHAAHVLHEDLYPENILVSGGNKIVIVDFDSALLPASMFVTRKTLWEELDVGYAFPSHGLSLPLCSVPPLLKSVFIATRSVCGNATRTKLLLSDAME
jgi:hypothetical protein